MTIEKLKLYFGEFTGPYQCEVMLERIGQKIDEMIDKLEQLEAEQRKRWPDETNEEKQ